MQRERGCILIMRNSARLRHGFYACWVSATTEMGMGKKKGGAYHTTLDLTRGWLEQPEDGVRLEVHDGESCRHVRGVEHEELRVEIKGQRRHAALIF